MKRSPMPPRRTPLRQKGRRVLREEAARKAFREALAYRSGGMCEVSTPACPPGPHRGHDGHHLCHADKASGVHLPSRGLWVCRLGHDWIEQHPAESYARGWLIRASDGAA